MTSLCGRRDMMGLLFAGSAVLLTGCGSDRAVASDTPAADLKQPKPPMMVYRDPECGCCGKWVEQAQAAGYPTKVEMRDDMFTVKTSLGVPTDLASCHTVMVGGYVVEGHVPFAYVDKLLKDQPRDIIGIAVPGMPRGSPGMEMPDGSVDEFEVIGFSRRGRTRVYSL